MITKPYILCAANWYDDKKEYPHQPKNIKSGFVVCGRRHHNCFAIMSLLKGEMEDFQGLDNYQLKNIEQGFLTSDDRWVSREEGNNIAKESKQIETSHMGGLISEDLY